MRAPSSSVVPDLALGDRIDECPLCRAPGSARHPVIRLQDAPAVDLLDCSRCGAMSADRMPTPEFLSSLYDPQTYRSSLVSEAGISRRCARAIIVHSSFHPDRPVSILDYGGSDGSLSTEIRTALIGRGHRAKVVSTVVDLHPRSDGPHQRWLTPSAFEASPDRYDLILASAVLEHLPDPAATLRSLIGRAAHGALFYGRTPWDGPLHLAVPGYRVKWPRHLHDMGADFWERFIGLFGVRGTLIMSRPSIVETSFRRAPLRTALAHLAKAPGRFENIVRPHRSMHDRRVWRYVGGWEVMIRFET